MMFLLAGIKRFKLVVQDMRMDREQMRGCRWALRGEQISCLTEKAQLWGLGRCHCLDRKNPGESILWKQTNRNRRWEKCPEDTKKQVAGVC
jgi:hypothetical protein